MPDSFTSVYSDEKAMKYLHKNNCWEAWSWGRATIKFDIAQNRVVFCVKDPETDEIVGAVGRGLNSNILKIISNFNSFKFWNLEIEF